MTQTHTPGPWRVLTRDRTSKPDRFGRTTDTHEVFINGADGLGSIAKLYVGHDQDARLIAAAPELLEALQNWIQACDTGTHTDINKAREQARAAIARAKGEA